VILFGTVEQDTHGGARLMMAAPQHELVPDEEPDAEAVHAGRVVPVYEKAGGMSGQVLRRVLSQLALQVGDDLPDPLPADVQRRLGVVPLAEALRALHRPAEDADVALLNRARGRRTSGSSWKSCSSSSSASPSGARRCARVPRRPRSWSATACARR
jgi:ATP-dependent DNA helicase RecG